MSDLTTSAASSIALSGPGAPLVNAPNSASQGGFCQIMNDKQFKPRIRPPAEEEKGQDDAASGKDLPEKDKSVDPALAWLFGAPPVILPIPTLAPPPPTTDLPAMLDRLRRTSAPTC